MTIDILPPFCRVLAVRINIAAFCSDLSDEKLDTTGFHCESLSLLQDSSVHRHIFIY